MNKKDSTLQTSSRLLSMESCQDIDDMEKLYINDFDNIFQWQDELEDSFSEEIDEDPGIGAFESLEQPFMDEDGALRIFTIKKKQQDENEKQEIVKEKETEKEEKQEEENKKNKKQEIVKENSNENEKEEKQEKENKIQTNTDWLLEKPKESPITYWNIGYDPNFNKK
ncbi:hypothetical protein M0812_00370 [Anaeramoeba flamelloides]|uniref:Uncharacterized protein n=1 Tax=Anaeramoeba flamelloides TaxID=1746091 RepID=A0AAV8A136_9EUKA|nr:hypothetical protein M0812_00370 [Anaeramoeba flamelloides]